MEWNSRLRACIYNNVWKSGDAGVMESFFELLGLRVWFFIATFVAV